MTVLVTGATGTTGSEVAAQLAEAGVPVRAMTRSADGAEALRSAGFEAVVARYDDPASLASALEDVSAAYLVTPAAEDMAEAAGAFARAAAEAEVHVVRLSVIGADPASPLRFGRAHADAEAAVQAGGGTWTFVRPNGFMQNDLAWAQQIPGGVVRGPVMDAAWSVVDVGDVAAVAVAALTVPDEHRGTHLTVTGPEARTPRERVAVLAELLVRELEAEELPIDAVKEHLRGVGLDPWTIDGLAELWELYATGQAAGVTDDVERVLGRRAGSWEAFATQNQAAFRGA